MEGFIPARISVATIFLKLLLKWQGSLGFQIGVFWYFVLCLDSLWIEVHHRAPHIGNKHVYVVPSLRQVTYLKKAFSGFLNPFLKNLLIQRKSATKIVRLAPLPSWIRLWLTLVNLFHLDHREQIYLFWTSEFQNTRETILYYFSRVFFGECFIYDFKLLFKIGVLKLTLLR